MNFQKTNIETLTHLLSKPDQSGLELVRLVQMCLLNNEQNVETVMESNIPVGEISETGFTSIGTWHPVNQNNEIVFVRREQADSIFWESSQMEIKQKKLPDIKRVCVIGESAAFGMFFTPHISPTIALAQHLKHHGEKNWDVIDLTRSCMNAGGLLATTKSCLQLEPDFIVIMAGNNWFSDVIFQHDAPISMRRSDTEILETTGPAGIANAYKKNFEQYTDKILQSLGELSKDSPAEFIFVIPASNYADWERRCPIHWLGNNHTAQWYELYQSAADALEKASYENALQLGLRMIKIDGGVAPTSNRIVANSLIALGRSEEAFSYCSAESDYAIMHSQITAFPGTPSFVRKKLLESHISNINFIDLEKIFCDYLNTKILGESLFVDYCHMTPEGFNVAMAPVASYLIKDIAQKMSWQDLLDKTNANIVDPFRLAISYFYIALYNSHLNEPVTNAYAAEAIVNLLQKSVNYSKEILDVMELYVQARSCYFGSGFSLSKAGQALFKLSNSPLDFPVAQAAPGTDALTIDAICTVLERNGRNGFDLRSQYQQHYIKLLKDGVDLTEPLYIERINSVVRLAVDSEISTRRKVPFFKSWWPRSYFTLAADNMHDLELILICRLPGESNSDAREVKITINNTLIDNIQVANKWSRHVMTVSKNSLSQGFNRLYLEWPCLAQNESHEISDLKKRHSLGLKVNMFPIFGEIFALKVRHANNN